MRIRDSVTHLQRYREAQAQKQRENTAALKIVKNWRMRKKFRKEMTAALQYYKRTGHILSHVSLEVKRLKEELLQVWMTE